MRNILLIGAGRSSSSLIRYFLDRAPEQDWTLTVADFSEELAKQKIGGHNTGRAIRFDIKDEKLRVEEISKSERI